LRTLIAFARKAGSDSVFTGHVQMLPRHVRRISSAGEFSVPRDSGTRDESGGAAAAQFVDQFVTLLPVGNTEPDFDQFMVLDRRVELI
jgi:hypothetical protein